MIFFTALMTAGTGAVCIATPHNLSALYTIVTIACVGVGGVIVPCSIIAQIACPDELIATITAITLSIRYVGGAIGFAVYYNIFFHKVTFCSGIRGRGGLHCLSRDEGRQAYEASHLR
jgi:hypothetical protein